MYLLKQEHTEEGFVYFVKDNDEFYRQTVIGTVKTPPVLEYGNQSTVKIQDTNSIDNGFDSLKAVYASFSRLSDQDDLLLNSYLLLTYCHQLFECIPTLQLSFSNTQRYYEFVQLVKDLCFNGMVVDDGHHLSTIAEVVHNTSATLIFDKPRYPKPGIYSSLLLPESNQKGKYFNAIGKNVRWETFSPRIHIQETPTKHLEYSDTITVNFIGSKQGVRIPNDELLKIRTWLHSFALKHINDIKKCIDLCSDTFSEVSSGFAIRVMASFLFDHGIISQPDRDKLIDRINGLHNKVDSEIDLLSHFNEFITDEHLDNKDISIEDFINRLKNELGIVLSAKSFIKTLKYYGLIKSRARLRPDVAAGGSMTSYPRRVWLINHDKLKTILESN